jgi:hypothetical protein
MVRVSAFKTLPEGRAMQQPLSKQLFAYWDHIRNARMTPHRLEIVLAKMANVPCEPYRSSAAKFGTFLARAVGHALFQTI